MSDQAPGPAPSTGEVDSKAKVQGIVLVVIAVFIGLLLLGKGLGQDDGTEVVAAGDTSDATTPVDESTTTTTEAPSARPAAEVPVRVENASTTTGLATANAEKLMAAGYVAPTTGNASPQMASVIYYTPGAEGDAVAVRDVLGLANAGIEPMPDPPPSELGTAEVLVIIGSDDAV